MQIETERLLIRDYTMDDAGDLYEILGDAEVMKNCEPAYSFEKTTDFLSDFCIEKRGAAAAVHKKSGKMIGYLLFHPFGEGVYEIGWFFNRKFWRQGYAYEASRALIEHAFRRLGAHKIFAETIDGVKSVGLMKKLGMQPEDGQSGRKTDSGGNRTELYEYVILRDAPSGICLEAAPIGP